MSSAHSPLSEPFFSVGVTTYDRVEMLIETLNSILGQTFHDYEVIVSNDNPHRTLTGNSLGINDPRVIFVNQSKNLGELYNMGFLLKTSRGKYFTWLADDELYAPNFLQAIYDALMKYDFPRVIFTSYATGDVNARIESNAMGDAYLYSGPQFIQRYLSRSLITQGCYGIFDIEYLRGIGGMEKMGNGFSPYSDNLLAIKSGLLERVVYINAPLILYRIHEGSLSCTSKDITSYFSAQEDLCRKSINILKTNGLRDNFKRNLYLLLKWCIGDYYSVLHRSGTIHWKQVTSYLLFISEYMKLLKGSLFFWKTIGFLIKGMGRGILYMGKKKLKLLFAGASGN